MNLLDLLFANRDKIQIKCSGFGCSNTVLVNPSSVLPDYVICSSCEERINAGIVMAVHAHTSKTQGSYNIFDEILH